jgi:hypothetical protein
MKSISRVIVLSVAGMVPDGLREALLKGSYESQSVESLKAAESALKSCPESAVLVHFGPDQDAAFSLLKSLLTATFFHTRPLILVGEEADTIVPELGKVFLFVGSCNTPCGAPEIVVEVKRLSELYWKLKDQQISSASEQLDSKIVALQTTPSVGSVTAHPSWGNKSLPDTFFQKLGELNLLGRTVGGTLYGRNIRLEPFLKFFDDQRLGLKEASEKALQGADSWVKGHVVRVAYIAFCLLRATGESTDSVIQSTRAALLHAASFRTKRRVARVDYFSSSDPEVRRRIAKVVRESATKVSFDLGFPDESIVIALLARLIARDEVTRDSRECKLAYGLYVADVIDRMCWDSGYFNPARGYALLKQAKQGALADMNPAIAVVAVKFISEAIVGSPPRLRSPAEFTRKYRQRIKNGEVENPRPRAGERQVSVEDLAPGMQLSRPLKTFDGREILESDLKLDEDLIWRLWQLTSIRPLEVAMIVSERKAAREDKAPAAVVDLLGPID